MIIKKNFQGTDNKERIWILNTDEKILAYSGYAKDFKTETAQNIINECDNYDL